MKLDKLLVALSLTFISGSAIAAGGDTATLKGLIFRTKRISTVRQRFLWFISDNSP